MARLALKGGPNYHEVRPAGHQQKQVSGHFPPHYWLLAIHLQMASSPFEGHPREVLRGPAYPRPLPHRGENEQGTGRSPRRRSAPHETRGPRPGPEEIPLAAAQARKRISTTSSASGLRDLLRYNLKTVRAYLLKEAFQQLWDYNSPAWAGKFLDEWCRQVMRSRIEPMKKIARSLRQHRELILNYFRAQKLLSSGVVEGLNNKAKVTMRKSYGFRTFRALELALYHSLGKLPEPESTHEFF